jgi:hypothetical protein
LSFIKILGNEYARKKEEIYECACMCIVREREGGKNKLFAAHISEGNKTFVAMIIG